MSSSKLKMLKQRLSPTSMSRVLIMAESTPRIRGRQWMKIKTDALMASDHWCVLCLAEGRQTIAVEVDHKTPLWRGGSNEQSNLQGLCKDHHDEKTAREAAERARGE
ncbi:HNH endonuclease [Herbaspirillum huttiense]|uniref:HNH endonuclease n=1 Tax=Herbaspirillum huttiense TaxID=863372 RepID=UPI0010667332|nr:HNH endonuclease signature motif containing protein [Herbaspirillum huttiense]QBP75394.1 HNH endonuclease [Herbaspirillum huttiense]